jgi:hypothetical protein
MLDAFGRLRVSNPQTLFSSQLQYDELDVVWSESLTGSASFVHNGDASLGELTVTTAAGDRVIRQSPHQAYQPGKSQLVLMTFQMVEGVENCRKSVGYFDDNNGIFLELDGSDVSLVLRSSVSGSPVDQRIPQNSWNANNFNTADLSPPVLDITKSQIFWIDIEWLGVGNVRCGFIIDGEFHLAHTFKHANLGEETYMTTANLPLRYEIENDAELSSGTVLRQVCGTVMSEGGFSEDFGFLFSTGNGITPIGVTTRRAVCSIRPKATFNSIVNRGIIIPTSAGILAQSEAGFVEIVYNGTLGGSPSWSSVNANSIVEYDIAGTTVTGGITVARFYVTAGGQGGNSFAGTGAANLAARYPLNLDIDGDNPKNLSVVVTSMTSTCNATGYINWKEIR